MRRLLALAVGLGLLAFLLRRGSREDRVTVWFDDGSALTLEGRSAAEIADLAQGILAISR
jgi:hypothetical protein